MMGNVDLEPALGGSGAATRRWCVEDVVNVCWCALALGVMANAWSLGLFTPAGPDSGLFPMICGLLILGCAIGLMLRGARARAPAPQWPRGVVAWRITGIVGGLVFMAATLPYLGFAVASAITTFALLQSVERSSWREALLLSVVSVAAVMIGFDRMLGLPLPRGPWGW